MPVTHESCNIFRLSHTSALGELFIADEWGLVSRGSLEIWFAITLGGRGALPRKGNFCTMCSLGFRPFVGGGGQAQPFRTRILAVAPSLSLRSLQRQGGDFDLLSPIPNAGNAEEKSSRKKRWPNFSLRLAQHAMGSPTISATAVSALSDFQLGRLAQPFRITILAVAPSLSLRSLQRQGGDFDLLSLIPNPGILVSSPERWAWSSFRHYVSGVEGVVEIESQ
jgi:hypothetical protein